MWIKVLRIEEDKIMISQMFYQMHQRHFTGIGSSKKHAFAKKSFAQSNTV
jgi:hypothetical protein